jgi:hypothetical protein
MEICGSWSRSQEPAAGSYGARWIQSYIIFFKARFNSIFYSKRRSYKCIFTLRFTTKNLYAFPTSPKRALCPILLLAWVLRIFHGFVLQNWCYWLFFRVQHLILYFVPEPLQVTHQLTVICSCQSAQSVANGVPLVSIALTVFFHFFPEETFWTQKWTMDNMAIFNNYYC